MRRVRADALSAAIHAGSIAGLHVAADGGGDLDPNFGPSVRAPAPEHITAWSRDNIVSSSCGSWAVGNTIHYRFPYADSGVIVSNGAADYMVRFATLDRKGVTVIYNSIAGDSRPRARPLVSAGFKTTLIYIGNDVWIGCKATVLRGAYVGNRCVIGAHALVKSRIPDDMLAVGVPARVVRRIESIQ